MPESSLRPHSAAKESVAKESAAKESVAKESVAEELDQVVDGLLDVTRRTHEVLAAVAARHDLTAQQVGLLRVLDEPVSMRAFAEELSCDPSNVTGLVDRVERLGLVDRIPDPDDRRIRMLTLTTKGRRLRQKINGEVARDLTAALGIGAGDHGRLLRLLAGLTPAPPATGTSASERATR